MLSGRYNDVWKFHTTLFMWSWMAGNSTTNIPTNYTFPKSVLIQSPSDCVRPFIGGRHGAALWKDDDGQIWLFGGFNVAGYVNDMWLWEPTTLEWTLIREGTPNNAQNFNSIYGVQGIPHPGNVP